MDDSTEGFFLEMSLDGGVTFTQVEEWNEGDEFVNTQNYTDAVMISGPFTSTTQFRFRCNASGQYDFVYFDKIVITGCEIQPLRSDATSKEEQIKIEKPELSLSNLYPNPTTSYVNLDLTAKVEGDLDIHLFDIAGQLVRSYTENVMEGKNSIYLELGDVPSGTYMLQINDGKKTDIRRLVIMK